MTAAQRPNYRKALRDLVQESLDFVNSDPEEDGVRQDFQRAIRRALAVLESGDAGRRALTGGGR